MNAAARLWQFDAQLPAAALAQIAEGVRIAEQQLSQGSDAQPIACALFEGEALLAGASGRTEGQRLFIGQLWVRADLRGQGLAGDCLRQLEAQALRRGCVDALAETLSDEAADLFEHLGYACIAHLHDYLPGLTRHTLLKVWQPRES